jgi:hypothetical protein
MATTIPQLAKIPPHRITIRDAEVVPTSRDRRAVRPDLTRYVSVSQVVSAVPEIAIRQATILAVNGVPFIQASADANPPIETIVCACHCDPPQLRNLGLEIVTAKECLEQLQSSMPLESTEMLCFDAPLDESKQRDIQFRVTVCCNNIAALWTVKHSILNYLEWQNDSSVIWKWTCMALEGPHALIIRELVHRIDADVSKVRSWNGLALLQ